MKVKDILPSYSLNDILVRVVDPYFGDVLFGYCHWDGKELISGDGDNYNLEDEISRYEFDSHDNLVYWLA